MLRRRAFTLIELMVASAIAFIIVAGAAALASAIARQVRETEEQGDIAARVAIAATVVQNALDGVAYAWRVEAVDGSNVGRGGPGEAHCANATGICTGAAPNGAVRPLSVCSSTGLNNTTCNVADTTSADGVRAIVPRDDVSESIRIVDRNTTPFAAGCAAGSIANPVTVDVRGAHVNAWGVGDLVLVAVPGHATVGVVRSALAAEADPTQTRTVDLELDPDGLANDDGGSTIACDALESLPGARITRVKQVVIRLNGTTLEMSQKPTTAAASFVPLLTDVEDFQVRLEVTHMSTAAGASRYCLADAPAINGVLYTGANVNATAPCNAPLDRDDPAGAPNGVVKRISGLHVGVLLRAGSQTTGFSRPIEYLFDRGPPGAADQRRRRPVYFFVGLTNAAQY